MKAIELLLATVLACTAGTTAVAETQCQPRPGDEQWLELKMSRREQLLRAERKRAIGLLREFLAAHPRARERAGVLFRLAELLWEQAQERFLEQMRAYDRQLDSFKRGKRSTAPQQPRIDLRPSLEVYEQLLENHPDFEQIDTVLYLYGFGLNEQGDEQAALSIYRTLIGKYPHSQFVPDAYMALAEYEFAKGHFRRALADYGRVLGYPQSNLHDLALYKSAWCHFKLGQPAKAAEKFRQVLARARSKMASGVRRVEAAAAELEREALEDLALTFSESGGAAEAYAFMKQVGGRDYSLQVLQRLGQVFVRQARFDKAIETYRMLLERFPHVAQAPRFADALAKAYLKSGKRLLAYRQYQALAENYGPGSSWAKQEKDRRAVAAAARLAEQGLRFVALARHQQAQKKPSKKAYHSAAASYRLYLEHFPDSAQAPRMRFQLAEVLFKLGQYQQAAETYLAAVAELKKPAQKLDAAYAAVLAYDQLRRLKPLPQEPPAQKQPLAAEELGFQRAARTFLELEPDQERAVELNFELGSMLYFRGHFRAAGQRLLALVRRHPRHKLAPSAAKLALDCRARLKEFAQLEKLARELLGNEQLANGEFKKHLQGVIAGAIFQRALQARTEGKLLAAAEQLQGLVTEFPADSLAPRALLLAADCLASAGSNQQATALYKRLMRQYPDQAADAIYILAGLYRRRYDYLHAAENLFQFARRFPTDKRAAPALLEAALLFRAKRNWSQQVAALKEFVRRFPGDRRAPQALFEAGLALEKAGQHRAAAATFKSYLRRFGARSGRVREARLHLALALAALGQHRAASLQLQRCSRYSSKNPPRGAELEAAAHCLFEQAENIFRRYQAIKLRPPKSRLLALLKQKAGLLKQAEAGFAKVVATGVLEWASAALYRVGDMYARFAKAIYEAPLPSGLSSREQEIYRQQVQALAFPVEDKALRAFQISLETARRHGYYTRWTVETRKQLTRLDPNNYPPLLEMRPRVEWADSYTSAPLLLHPLPTQKAPTPGKGGKR